MSREIDLQRLRAVRRREHHPLIHHIHKEHKISKRTLFYVKEYGQSANVPKTIIKESIKILLFASIISALGGLALEHIKEILISLAPLIILLPTLNDMIGDYGTIVSSRFSTMLHEGKVHGKWWENKELKQLFAQIFLVALLTTVLSAVIAMLIFSVSSHAGSIGMLSRIILISVLDVVLLVSILFVVSVLAGLYIFKKGEDPNNFLIPLTTSIADFGNMIILSVLIVVVF